MNDNNTRTIGTEETSSDFEMGREVENHEEKKKEEKRGRGRYVCGKVRSQGNIRVGNIIIQRVKKLKDREEEEDKGKR